MDDIIIDDAEEIVYDLNSIGIIGAELVLHNNIYYILTENAYFVLSDAFSFEKCFEGYVLCNEEGDSLVITDEQFSIVSNILSSKFDKGEK